MRNTIIIILLFVVVTLTYSENDIYYISGMPSKDGENSYPTSIYRIDSITKKLDLVKVLFPEEISVCSIRNYPSMGFFIISLPSWSSPGLYKYSLFRPTNDVFREDLEIKYPENFSVVHEFVLNIPKKGLYQAIYLSAELNKHQLLLGTNLDTKAQEELELEDLQYLYLTGNQGNTISTPDIFGYIKVSNKRVQSFNNTSLNVLPESLPTDDIKNPTLFVSNEFFKSLVSYKDEGKGTDILIQNKNENKWYRIKYKEPIYYIKGIGPWMIGSFQKQDKMSEERMLLIHNVEDKSEITISSGSTDSEIITIINNDIYYRVDDKISKAILESGNITNKELLVGDPIVKNIHWMFFTDKDLNHSK